MRVGENRAAFRFAGRFPDGCAVVALPAEIDITNAAEVSAVLMAALDHRDGGVIADMSGTRFCDLAGLRAVLRAAHRAELLGTWLRVVITQHAVRRIFALTGADGLLAIYPDTGAALAAGASGRPVPDQAHPPAFTPGLMTGTGGHGSGALIPPADHAHGGKTPREASREAGIQTVDASLSLRSGCERNPR